MVRISKSITKTILWACAIKRMGGSRVKRRGRTSGRTKKTFSIKEKICSSQKVEDEEPWARTEERKFFYRRALRKRDGCLNGEEEEISL